jgi:hypothetical protein
MLLTSVLHIRPEVFLSQAIIFILFISYVDYVLSHEPLLTNVICLPVSQWSSVQWQWCGS